MSIALGRLMIVFAVCWVPVRAGTISYTASGTFTASTPSYAFTGPSETWAFAFQADTNPAILESDTGAFDFAFSNFSYSLDGSPVAITPAFIRFFSATIGGGWLMCFNGAIQSCTEGLATAGPQMYTGATSAPTLLPGAFTSDVFVVFMNRTLLYEQPNTTVQGIVPEPSTLLILAAGLLALGGRRLCRRK